MLGAGEWWGRSKGGGQARAGGGMMGGGGVRGDGASEGRGRVRGGGGHQREKKTAVMIWTAVTGSPLLQHVPSSKFIFSLQYMFSSSWPSCSNILTSQ